MKNKIILICGDPNSINSEIIYKSWNKLNINVKRSTYLIGNYDLLKKQFKKLKIKIKISEVKDINDQKTFNGLKILNVKLKFKDPFKVKFIDSSKYVKKCLNLGHQLASNKKNIKGIINCAIDKKLLKNKGVTEFLAFKNGIKNNSEVMMIYNKRFSVVPLTTHIKIKKVSKNLTKKLIEAKIKTLNKFYFRIFKKRVKIGILGLNPHNSELSISSEEKLTIIPAIKSLKKIKINVSGPIVSDTAFVEIYKKFDVIVGMYHDQVLIPFKALFHFDAINITLGLKYPRVSPDHGTAVDLIGKMKANPSSLIKCLNFINKINK